MSIFDFESYKKYIHVWIKSQPKLGHGQMRKIAEALGLHTTMVSQIFRGDKHLSIEHAQELASYLGLRAIESDYLILLVQIERAGTKKLRDYYRLKLTQLKDEATNLGRRLSFDRKLTESEQAEFYSSWIMSATRLLTEIPEFGSARALSEALQIDITKMAKVVDVLLNLGLIVERDGRLRLGPAHTYVPRESTWAARHHVNWRLKAIERVDSISTAETMFTSPLNLSNEDFGKVQKMVVQFIEDVRAIASPSPAEKTAVLLLDWFSLLPLA